MGIPSDRRFLAVAAKRLRHLFPNLPGQPGYFKRRRRWSETIEWLLGVFASQSPGYEDDLLLVDSTPVECARSRETVKRWALADAADYGYCRSHSRSLSSGRSSSLGAAGASSSRPSLAIARGRAPRTLALRESGGHEADDMKVGTATAASAFACRLAGPVLLSATSMTMNA